MKQPLTRYMLAWLTVLPIATLALIAVLLLADAIGFAGSIPLRLDYLLSLPLLALLPAYLIRGLLVQFAEKLPVKLGLLKLPVLGVLTLVALLVYGYLQDAPDGIYIRAVSEISLLPLMALQALLALGVLLAQLPLLRRVTTQ